jgi:hypothetical protein
MERRQALTGDKDGTSRTIIGDAKTPEKEEGVMNEKKIRGQAEAFSGFCDSFALEGGAEYGVVEDGSSISGNNWSVYQPGYRKTPISGGEIKVSPEKGSN